MRKICSALLAGVAGGALLLQATAAGAATVKPVPGHAITKTAPARGASPHVLGMPKGYTEVNSGPLDAVNGTQTLGSVTCPGKEQPSGGGVIVLSDALGASVNSSYPDGQSWIAYVNDTSGSDTDFYVYAVCLAKSAGYTVVTATGTVADSTQSVAADCPAHTTVLGGGAVSNTYSTGVAINSTVPNQLKGSHTAWRVAMASSDATTSNFTVYAICRAKPAGYSIQFGSGVDNTAGAQDDATVSCPGSSVAIGGGGFSAFASTDTAIDMNSTWPGADYTWGVAENNGGTIDRSLYAAVICAGT
jgi:hypothetical protein